MRAHAREANLVGNPEFRLGGSIEADEEFCADVIETCSYCGSMAIDDVIKYMQTPGTRFSGSDWKYGYPHKFYIDIPCEPHERILRSRYVPGKNPEYERGICTMRSHKFYSEHLVDATSEQLQQWNGVVAPLLGVEFSLDSSRELGWRALGAGYQAHGVVE